MLENRQQRNSVLLTIDLTTAVANEAIRRRDSLIVAYRMFLKPMRAVGFHHCGLTHVWSHPVWCKRSNYLPTLEVSHAQESATGEPSSSCTRRHQCQS